MMKRLTSLAISGVLVTTLGAMAACGNRAKLETCQFVEIEDAEFEAEFGDLDAERGEVEMVCGDEIIDVSWSQFRSKLQVDPGQYKGNLEAFKRQVTCMKDERRNKEVFCNGPRVNEFVALSFSYDD
jgi:hypothetical protein